MTRSADHTNRLAALGVACSVLASGSIAAAQPAVTGQAATEANRPDRSGLTLELGLGAAISNFPFVQGSETHVGLAPLSLSLGGFVNPHLAVMVRASGTSFFKDGTDYNAAFYGVAAQYWINDDVFVGGGAGLAVNFAVFGDHIVPSESKGLGLTARAGYAFYSVRDHAFATTLELFPSISSGGVVQLGAAANLQWQWL